MSPALKIIMVVIFLAAFGFSVWLNYANSQYWNQVHTAPLIATKDRTTGDVLVRTPYGSQFMFKSMCQPEWAL